MRLYHALIAAGMMLLCSGVAFSDDRLAAGTLRAERFVQQAASTPPASRVVFDFQAHYGAKGLRLSGANDILALHVAAAKYLRFALREPDFFTKASSKGAPSARRSFWAGAPKNARTRNWRASMKGS